MQWTGRVSTIRKIGGVGVRQIIRSTFRGVRVTRGCSLRLLSTDQFQATSFPIFIVFASPPTPEEFFLFEDLPLLQRLLGPSMLAVHSFNDVLYHFDQVFSHASQPKKSLTQNVFLSIFPISFGFFLIKIYRMCEHLVEMVQY